MKNGITIMTAAMVGLGIAVAGWFIGHGFFKGRAAERFVTVKGVSERDVKANVALWPLRFVSTDDDLSQAQMKWFGRNKSGIVANMKKRIKDQSEKTAY